MKRINLSLFLIVFLIMIGQGIVVPKVTILITNGNTIGGALIVSSFSIGSLIMAPFLGKYISTIGPKKIIIFFLPFYALFISITLLLPITNLAILIIILLRFVSGFLLSAIYTSVEAIISVSETQKNQSKTFFNLSIINAIGMISGPFIGLFFSVYVALAYILTSLIIVYIISYKINYIYHYISPKKLKLNVNFFHPLLGIFLFGFAISTFETFSIAYIYSTYHIENYNIVVIILFSLFLFLLTLLYLFKINFKLLNIKSAFNFILFYSLIISISLIFLYFYNNIYIAILLFVLLGISLSGLANAILVFLSGHSKDKATVLSWKNTVLAFGTSIGPILSSFIYNINKNFFFIFLGILFLFYTILLIKEKYEKNY